MFKQKSNNDKMRAFIDGMMKDAFDAGFSAGWDAALKTLVDRVLKRETQKEENELKWEDMRDGKTKD